jgi:hypothetical protein
LLISTSAFIADDDFGVADLKFDSFTDRYAYWVEKRDSEPTIVFWFWKSLGSTVNLRFIFQDGEPTDREARRVKRRMRNFLDAAFIYILDWVFLYCVDMDLVTPTSEDRWDEWAFVIPKLLETLKSKPVILRNDVELGKWPSYVKNAANDGESGPDSDEAPSPSDDEDAL